MGQEASILGIVSMEAVFAAALDNLEILIAETNVDVSHGKLPAVEGGGVQLIQVVQNLIANGIKDGRRDIQPCIRINAEKREQFWRFSISDNGEGIPAEYREQIFLPFKRLHGSEVPGIGMGIPVCRKIVERHGGEMSLISQGG